VLIEIPGQSDMHQFAKDDWNVLETTQDLLEDIALNMGWKSAQHYLKFGDADRCFNVGVTAKVIPVKIDEKFMANLQQHKYLSVLPNHETIGASRRDFKKKSVPILVSLDKQNERFAVKTFDSEEYDFDVEFISIKGGRQGWEKAVLKIINQQTIKNAEGVTYFKILNWDLEHNQYRLKFRISYDNKGEWIECDEIFKKEVKRRRINTTSSENMEQVHLPTTIMPQESSIDLAKLDTKADVQMMPFRPDSNPTLQIAQVKVKQEKPVPTVSELTGFNCISCREMKSTMMVHLECGHVSTCLDCYQQNNKPVIRSKCLTCFMSVTQSYTVENCNTVCQLCEENLKEVLFLPCSCFSFCSRCASAYGELCFKHVTSSTLKLRR